MSLYTKKFHALLVLGLSCLAVPATAQVLPDAQPPQVVYVIASDAETISDLNVDSYGLLSTPAPTLEAPVPDQAELAPIPEPMANAMLIAAMLVVFVVTKMRYRARARSIYGS